jgi:hypothetical protein
MICSSRRSSRIACAVRRSTSGRGTEILSVLGPIGDAGRARSSAGEPPGDLLGRRAARGLLRLPWVGWRRGRQSELLRPARLRTGHGGEDRTWRLAGLPGVGRSSGRVGVTAAGSREGAISALLGTADSRRTSGGNPAGLARRPILLRQPGSRLRAPSQGSTQVRFGSQPGPAPEQWHRASWDGASGCRLGRYAVLGRLRLGCVGAARRFRR